jgi:hypothetical protein
MYRKGGLVMKKLVIILGSVFVFIQLNAQQNVMPQTQEKLKPTV